MARHRFKIKEYSSGFVVIDTVTKEESWISDGVDLLFTESGKAVSPSSKCFVKRLQHAINIQPDQTLEAYFLRQYEKEAN